MYQAESCAGERRGKLSVIVVLHNVVFYCFASWLTLACSYAGNEAQWRLPLALQVGHIPDIDVGSVVVLTPVVGAVPGDGLPASTYSRVSSLALESRQNRGRPRGPTTLLRQRPIRK